MAKGQAERLILHRARTFEVEYVHVDTILSARVCYDDIHGRFTELKLSELGHSSWIPIHETLEQFLFSIFQLRPKLAFELLEKVLSEQPLP